MALRSAGTLAACPGGGRGAGGGGGGAGGEGRDAKVGQECNWTLRTPTQSPPSRVAGRGGQRQPWKASLLLLWFPSIIGGRLPGDPEGCVSL